MSVYQLWLLAKGAQYLPASLWLGNLVFGVTSVVPACGRQTYYTIIKGIHHNRYRTISRLLKSTMMGS